MTPDKFIEYTLAEGFHSAAVSTTQTIPVRQSAVQQKK